MKIELEISDKNEATESPWWFLIDPRSIKDMLAGAIENNEIPSDASIYSTVAMGTIEGPFFSRKEAEEYLNSRSYDYSKETIVWCGSGYRSHQYKTACRKAMNAQK